MPEKEERGMLSVKENFFETVKPDGHPDRLMKQYEGLAFLNMNPVLKYIRGDRHPGMPPTKDRFGTEILWPEGQVAAMPHVTETNKVIPDITEWKDYLKIPDIVKECSDPALWEPYIKQAEEYRAEGKILMGYLPTGLFERLHFLMGFEDMLMNFLLEPEAMHELIDAIGEYRYQFMKMSVDYLKPDVVISHDDWGSKRSMFISPDTWREFIKPHYQKMYSYMNEKGVLVMHHADSFLEPIIDDMVEIGINIWQGALPENDIVKIQKQVNGKMTLMGGIDASVVDRADSTEEEIRTEARRVCETYAPGGHFIPCITYGGPGCLYKHVDPIINDEIDKYNKKVYGV